MNDVSYHLIDGVWNRVVLPNITDKDAMMRARVKLGNRVAERIVLLEEDGTGWMPNPRLNKDERYVPADEMLMIRLSAVDWI